MISKPQMSGSSRFAFCGPTQQSSASSDGVKSYDDGLESKFTLVNSPKNGQGKGSTDNIDAESLQSRARIVFCGPVQESSLKSEEMESYGDALESKLTLVDVSQNGQGKASTDDIDAESLQKFATCGNAKNLSSTSNSAEGLLEDPLHTPESFMAFADFGTLSNGESLPTPAFMTCGNAKNASSTANPLEGYAEDPLHTRLSLTMLSDSGTLSNGESLQNSE
jgi:hypothetical protein